MFYNYTLILKKTRNIYRIWKLKKHFLCQIANKDHNTPQAKRILPTGKRRNGSNIQEAISTIPKTTFYILQWR